MPARQKAKPSENKATPEKAIKNLSPKRQMEADHLAGKHKEHVGNCEFCNRRASRAVKKEQATKRYFASQKS